MNYKNNRFRHSKRAKLLLLLKKLAFRRKYRFIYLLALLIVLLITFNPKIQPQQDISYIYDGEFNTIKDLVFLDDITSPKKIRTLRVGVNYSITDYYLREGKLQGFMYDSFLEFENFLNNVLKPYHKIKIVFIPVDYDVGIQYLSKGHIDLLVNSKQHKITFPQFYKNVNKLINPNFSIPDNIEVINPNLRIQNYVLLTRLNSVISQHKEMPLKEDEYLFDELEQEIDNEIKSVFYSQGLKVSKELHSLLFTSQKQQPLIFAENNSFSDADLLHLLDFELIDYAMIAENSYQLWKAQLPKIKPIITEVQISYERNFLVRKNSPNLKKYLQLFLNTAFKSGSRLRNIYLKRYFNFERSWEYNTNLIMNNQFSSDVSELHQHINLYAAKYKVDPILVHALAFKESGLKHNLVSNKGAVGVLQVMPSTAYTMGINNVYDLEQNIHAGIKYISYLQNNFFSSKEYDEHEALNFSIASYNAGPNKVKTYQKLTNLDNLNPKKWFYNVEELVKRKYNYETYGYVLSVKNYYNNLRRAKIYHNFRRKKLEQYYHIERQEELNLPSFL